METETADGQVNGLDSDGYEAETELKSRTSKPWP